MNVTLWTERYGGNPQALRAGLGLWMRWSVLTWLAFVVSLALIEIGERSDLSVVEGMVGGGLIGLAQGAALMWQSRSAEAASLPCPRRWTFTTLLSWGLLAFFQIGLLGWMVPESQQLAWRSLIGLLYGGYVGLGLGVGQWLAVRQRIAMAWRWIPLNGGIWALSMSLGWTIGGSLRLASNLFLGEVFGLTIAWGVVSVLSGLAMAGMMYPQAMPTRVKESLTGQKLS